MKKLSITLVCLFITMMAFAQEGPRKFSPEKFKADLEEYIVKEAKLTPQEAAKFLPIFGEMHEKQRVIYGRQRELRMKPLTDEAGYKDAIKKADQMDLELKTLQQTYHNKFLCVLPASKVFEVIKAEDRFYRDMWKRWGHNHRMRR